MSAAIAVNCANSEDRTVPQNARPVYAGSQPPRNASPVNYAMNKNERSVPRMNTKNKTEQKNQRHKTRQEQRPKKQGQSPNMHHEHELPETRLTR